MARSAYVVLLLFALASQARGQASALDWLAGYWCGVENGIASEELWLAPRAGMLVGVHRDSAAGQPRGFEYFRIVEDGGELVYWAQPQGKLGVPFRGRPATGTIDFVNDAHPFPKRVRYRRVDPDTLLARIDDGTDTGRSVEWRWRRECPPPGR